MPRRRRRICATSGQAPLLTASLSRVTGAPRPAMATCAFDQLGGELCVFSVPAVS